MTEDFRQLIVSRSTAGDLKAVAMRNGMRPLRHDGWVKCKMGNTTIDEVLRVTLEDEIMSMEDLDDLARATATTPLQPLLVADATPSAPPPEPVKPAEITRTFELEP